MSLTLSVLSFKGQSINQLPVTISHEGGTIGRSPDNNLVLADTDKIVSRHHVSIKFENGYYYLTDTSLGGVLINNTEPPIHNQTIRLDNGTLLKIGEYEISVSIAEQQMVDDFPFPITPIPIANTQNDFLSVNEPWVESSELANNSLFSDNFAAHEELIQRDETPAPIFHSQLGSEQSPLFDSYIAPNISESTPVNTVIPENFSFDDLFADNQATSSTSAQTTDSFDDLFGSLIENAMGQSEPLTEFNSVDTETVVENDLFGDANSLFADSTPDIEPMAEPSNLFSDRPTTVFDDNSPTPALDLFAEPSQTILDDSSAVIEAADVALFEESTAPTAVFDDRFDAVEPIFSEQGVEPLNLFGDVESVETASPLVETQVLDLPKEAPLFTAPQPEPAVINTPVPNVATQALFEAFLKGVGVDSQIPAEQQAETLERIGQMFRELIDGTVSVLRSRAEFKSMCRVSMTVIRATDNNPLKAIVSTDDVLRQLIENKKSGFLNSSVAIEEAFSDIMNHQMAMQAGIQASLTDLLENFNPKRIEKQFEQGIVLQKKAKCWESFEKTYSNTVEEAVENFYGDEFVKAYEQQMNVLKKSRK